MSRAFTGPILLFISGLREGERVQIQAGSCILGRDPSVDIQVDSPFVSRQHAEIHRVGGYWYITDLFSKNGIFINQVRVAPGDPVALHNQDVVQVGSVTAFKFRDLEATIHESQLQMRSPGLWLDEPNRDVYLQDARLEPPLTPSSLRCCPCSSAGGTPL